jgi:hypothetical protein
MIRPRRNAMREPQEADWPQQEDHVAKLLFPKPVEIARSHFGFLLGEARPYGPAPYQGIYSLAEWEDGGEQASRYVGCSCGWRTSNSW